MRTGLRIAFPHGWAALLLSGLFLTSLAGCFPSGRGQGGSVVDHSSVSFDIAPCGEQIVFCSASADLFLLDLTTLRVTQLTKTKEAEWTPAFSPDGKWIVYAATPTGSEASHIFIRSRDGRQVKQLTSDKRASDSMPSFSSDGAQLVFARAQRHRPYSMGGWTWDNYDAYVMNRDGTKVRRITQQNYYQMNRPQFLAQDKTLVYGATGKYPNLTSYLLTAAMATGQTKLLTTPQTTSGNNVAFGTQPDVPADGKRIVFISDRAQMFSCDVLVMNADGTQPTPLQVPKNSGYNSQNQHPVLTPDANKILYLGCTEESTAQARRLFGLWQVDTTGANIRCIADSSLFTNPLVWKPKKQ